jgi:hypothetical protein
MHGNEDQIKKSGVANTSGKISSKTSGHNDRSLLAAGSTQKAGGKGNLQGQCALVLRIKIKTQQRERKANPSTQTEDKAWVPNPTRENRSKQQPIDAQRFDCRTKQQGLISPSNSNWIHWQNESTGDDRTTETDSAAKEKLEAHEQGVGNSGGGRIREEQNQW